MSNNKISVIIVNYNSSKFLNKLIKTLDYINEIIGEILIVNNSPQDEPNIKLTNKTTIIKNTENVGFAKAVNQAISISKSDFILLLNPDTLLTDDSITKLYNEIKNDDKIGAIGGRIIRLENGEISYTATAKPSFLMAIFEFTNFKKIFPNNYYSRLFWLESNNITEPTNVESLCGAFILFKKYIDGKINLFDERYFMYFEDVDFGININNLGYKVVFDPNAQIMHFGGGSSKSKYRTALKHWYSSRKKFFQKHMPVLSGLFLYIMFTVEEFLLYIFHKLKNTPNE